MAAAAGVVRASRTLDTYVARDEGVLAGAAAGVGHRRRCAHMLTKSRGRAGLLGRRRGHSHEHGRRRQARGGHGRRDGPHRERGCWRQRRGGDGAARRAGCGGAGHWLRWGLPRGALGGRGGVRHEPRPATFTEELAGLIRFTASPAPRFSTDVGPSRLERFVHSRCQGGEIDLTTGRFDRPARQDKLIGAQAPRPLGKCNQRSRTQTAPRASWGTRPRARTAQRGQGHSSTCGRRGDARAEQDVTICQMQPPGTPKGVIHTKVRPTYPQNNHQQSPYLCRPTPGKATAAQSSPSGAASLISSS